MALVDRLRGAEDPKIPVHQFWAGMVEIALGEVTVAQFKTFFDLTGQDATDFDFIVSAYQASSNQERFLQLMHVIFLLAEQDTPGYNTSAALSARINRIP